MSRTQLQRILSQNQGRDISLIEQELSSASNNVKSLRTQITQYDVKLAQSKASQEKTEDENKLMKSKSTPGVYLVLMTVKPENHNFKSFQ